MSDIGKVEWKTIATPGNLLWLMFTQLTPHIQVAIKAGKEILSGSYNVESASAFLFSAAVVGDFFWPSAKRSQALSKAFPARARDMRHLVGLPDDEPPGLDVIRNDLTHVDERLEELFLQDPDGPMVAWGDGSEYVNSTQDHRGNLSGTHLAGFKGRWSHQ
jgi:hypothetical protein